MAISTMPLTALATTTNYLYYDDMGNGYKWYDSGYNEITDGYAELAPLNDIYIINHSSDEISISNSFIYDVMGDDTISDSGYFLNMGMYDTTYYLRLNGTTITVSDTAKDCTHPNIYYVEATDPTVTTDGYKAHYYCPDCKKTFADKDATTELSGDSLVSQYALGGNFMVDNMSFWFLDGHLHFYNYVYSKFDDLVIPSTVTYEGTTYNVEGISCNFTSDIESITVPKSIKIINYMHIPNSATKVIFEDASTLQQASFNGSSDALPKTDNTSTSGATVTLQGFRNGKTSSESAFYKGQLLKTVLSGYTGSNSLLYKFSYSGGDDISAASVFATPNMYAQKSGFNNNQMLRNAYYGISTGAKATDVITCDVYEIVKGDNGTASLSKIATTSETLSNLVTDDNEALAKEFSENNLFIMKKGDTNSLNNIFGYSSFTHVTCDSVSFSDVTLTSGSSVSIDGQTLTANSKGLSKISFSTSASKCFYHGTTTSPVSASAYIYVLNEPTITTTSDSIKIKDTNTGVTTKYFIGDKEATKESKVNTFSGLDYSTEYTIRQEVTATVGGNTETSVYYYTATTNAKKVDYNKEITVSWKDGYTPSDGDTVATAKDNITISDSDMLSYEIEFVDSNYNTLDDTDTLTAGSTYSVIAFVKLNDSSLNKFSTTQAIEGDAISDGYVYYTSAITVFDTEFPANKLNVGDDNGYQGMQQNVSKNTETGKYYNNNSLNDKIDVSYANDDGSVTYPTFSIIDKSALESAITKAKDEYLNTGYADAKYTAETLSALKTATTAGETEYDSEVSTQATVNTATANILNAIDSLELKEYTVKVINNGDFEETNISVKYGEPFSASATLDDGESVYKWVKSTDDGDTLLATNSNSVSVVVTSNMSLCYYTETAPAKEATTALVKYVDKSEKVVATDYVTIGDSYTPNDDNAPTLAFYSFSEWEVVQGNLTSATKVGIVLKAKYTVSKTEANKVTIIGLDGVTVQGETEYDAYYDEKVTLAGGTNYVFCKADGTEISSINDTYIYAPHLNETIYIKSVYTKSSNASTRITGSFTANNYFTINAQYYVPDGCTAVEAGVVVSKTNADPTIGGDSCTKLVSNSQGDNHEYSISIKCSSTGTLNTKSYLIYKDASGNLNTVYSDANALSYGA